MKWTGRTARRVPRAAARAAALAGMLAVSGLAAGVASASGDNAPAARSAAVSVTYQCSFPSGTYPVTVGVTAGIPAVAATGKPIRPAGVSLALTLPPAAVAGLTSLHAATVSAVTRLTISATEGPRGISLVWPGATAHPVRLPAHGSMTLTTAGAVPPVTASSPGEVVFTAAGLSVTLTAGRTGVPAPGPAQSPTPNAGGRAATPTPTPTVPTPTPGPASSPFQVGCTLAPGQHAKLGVVLVTGKTRPGAGRHAAVTAGKCPKLPKGGLKFNPRFPLPPPIKAPGTRIIHFPAQGCAYTTGYADARKLKGSILLTPALTNVELTVREVVNFNPTVNFAELDNVAELDFHGLQEFPPSTATFLSFGFVPTTATVALVEHGTINIFAIGPAIPVGCKPNKFQNCITTATVYSRLSVNILPGTVKVNGVPLNVGTRCQTPAFNAIVVGLSSSNPPYSIQNGGALTGLVTIPKFHNCGVGENLDPIFNAAISGPRNFNLLTQGVVCFVTGGLGCNNKGVPVPPTPIRKVIG